MVEQPILNPHEEEKYPDAADLPDIRVNGQSDRNVSSGGGTATDQLNQQLAELAQKVELHMETLLTAEGYSEQVKASFEALPACIQDVIAYRVWESFGKMQGIHNDFGRHSYLHLPGQLNEAYFANPESRIQIVCTLLDELRTL